MGRPRSTALNNAEQFLRWNDGQVIGVARGAATDGLAVGVVTAGNVTRSVRGISRKAIGRGRLLSSDRPPLAMPSSAAGESSRLADRRAYLG